MNDSRKRVLRRWLFRALGAGLLLALLYTLVGFLLLPRLLKGVIETQLTQALHRRTTLRALHLNPWRLSAGIEGLAIAERDATGAFLTVEAFEVNLEARSIWARAPILREVRIDRPALRLRRHADGAFNFSDLLEGGSGGPTPVFSVNNIQLRGGSVALHDDATGGDHVITGIQLDIPFIAHRAYYEDIFVEPKLKAVVDGRPLSVEGQVKPFAQAREAHIALDLRDIDLLRYLPYVPLPWNGRLTSGSLSVAMDVNYTETRRTGARLIAGGRLDVRDIAVATPDGAPALRLPAVSVEGILFRLPDGHLKIDRVRVQEPEAALALDEEGRLNLLALLPAAPAGAPVDAPKPSASPVVVEIGAVHVAGAHATFADHSAGRRFQIALPMADLKIGNLTTAPGRPADFALLAYTDLSESIQIKGRFALAPAAVEGMLEVNRLRLARYAPYYRHAVNFDIESGSLDLVAGFRAAPEEPALSISDALLSVSSLALRHRRGGTFLKLPLFVVAGAGVDLAQRRVTVDRVQIERPALDVVRMKSGEIDLAGLLPADAPDTSPAPPWRAAIKEVVLEEGAVTAIDRSPSAPAEIAIERLSVRLENLSTAPGTRTTAKVQCALGKTGRVALDATVIADRPAVELHAELQNVPLRTFQPYVTDEANVLISDGRLSASADAAFEMKGGAPLVRATGRFSLDGVALLEKRLADDLVAWASLQVEGIEFGTQPLRLHIGAAQLDGLRAHVIVNADGAINLLTLRPESPAPTPPAAPAGEAPELKLGAVALRDGRVSFLDRSIRPHFAMEIDGIEARLAGLDPAGANPTDLSLKGRLGRTAPLEVTGRLRPDRENLLVDLHVAGRGIELAAFTPYAVRHVAYPVEKGKLSLDLEYRIDRRALRAKNGIFFDQFTLGERVENPEATRLPVKLALALLTDRRGEIHLDVPLTGSLDDPKFSVWRLALQALENVVEKAATAPFALLGAAFGGGAELSRIDFDPGQSALTETARARLDTLAKALADRPALKLEITGEADPAADPPGLKEALLDQRIKAQKLKESARKEQAPASAEEITVTPEEYGRYLLLAYETEGFSRARLALGKSRAEAEAEMKESILQRLAVSDDDLRALAQRRAAAARDHLIAAAIEPDRLFLLEPAEKAAGARATFSLK